MDIQEEGNASFNGDGKTSHPSSDNVNTSAVTSSPFALHAENKENESQTNNTDKQENAPKSHSLRAPYAQPVLDASKLTGTKRSSVDERIALVRERRLHHQQALEQEAQMRRAKDDAAYAKWEQTQEERRRKMDENREKEEARRKEVELRKKQRLDEEKKRAETIVARTEQQATVVLRQKRTASVDRTKRWSWGAGGYGGGGGGGVTYATAVPTAPGPFHYFDPTRMTKNIRSAGLGRACRPKSMTASNLDLSLFTTGDDDKPSGNAGSGRVGYGSPTAVGSMQRDDKFSKSPLLMGTAHMAFASGLRSYDSSPVSNTSKQSSPATTPRSGRARSSDTRTKSRSQNSSVNLDGPTNKTSTRGRSPAARRTQSVKKAKAATSPQLTEPTQLSARLLAPTKASMARSKQGDGKQDDNTSTVSIGPVRSRSNDRRPTRDRPSSAKSDSSSASSSTLSPRAPISTTPKSRPMGRTPSPSLYKPRSANQKTPTLQSSSSPNLSQRTRGQSPQLRSGSRRAPSPAAKTPDTSSNKSTKPASRGTSPARQPPPSAPRRSSTGTKRTPIRDVKPQPNKSTPPAIKQPLKKGISLGKTKSPVLPSKVKPSIEKKDKKNTDANPAAETELQSAPIDKPTPANEPAQEVSSQNPQSNVQESTVEVAAVSKDEPSDDLTKTADINVANTTSSLTESESLNKKEVLPIDKPSVNGSSELEPEEVASADNVETPVIKEENLHRIPSENPAVVVTDQALNHPTLQAELENAEPMPEPAHKNVQEPEAEITTTINQYHVKVETPTEEVNTPAEIKTITQEVQVVTETDVHEEKDVNDQVSKPTNEEPGPVEVPVSEPENPDVAPEKSTTEISLPEEVSSAQDEEMVPVVAMVPKDGPPEQGEEMVPVVAMVPKDGPPEQGEEMFPVVDMVPKDGPPQQGKEMVPVVAMVPEEGPSKQDEEMVPEDGPSEQDEGKVPVVAMVTEEGPSQQGEEQDTVVTVVEKSEVEEPEKMIEPECVEEAPHHDDEAQQPSDETPTDSVSDKTNVAEETSQMVEETKEIISEHPAVSSEEITPPSDPAPTVAVPSDSTPVSTSPAPISEPAPSKEAKSVPEVAPVQENKRKEKKLTPEEQAYKEAMAAKRREAKEKREREEQERQERKKLEAEERARRVEIALRMAEEAKQEEEERLREEKRLQEEEELRKKQEAEEMARKHEEFIREQKEKVEQKAKEEAEKVRKERNLAAQKKEEERLQRKKRLEMIMRRTRGGDSPTPPDTSPSTTTPSGDSSPANITPTGGRSPYNSVTPDRMVSPSTVETPTLPAQQPETESSAPVDERAPSATNATPAEENMTSAPRDVTADNVTEAVIPTLILPDGDTSVGAELKSQVPEPLLAFVEGVNGSADSNTFVPVKEQNGRVFDPVESGDGKVALNGSNPFAGEEGFAEQQYAKMQEVPTGNLLEF